MDKKLLVIDDDKSVSWIIKKALESLGYIVDETDTIKAGIEVVSNYKLILLDLVLPDGNGLDALVNIRAINPDALVIIITAHGHVDSAIKAMKEGAYDYIEKPFDIEELKILIEKAFRDILLREELINLKQERNENLSPQIIASSSQMLKVFKEIGKIAPKDVTILITGESGTGKELVAKAIHNNSKRRYGPFVPINSASIPKELLEAELFGWEKGAFTGAVDRKVGRIQSAEGGTLFLDEISELDFELQAKLLRFIQEKEYSPLGSNKSIKADVRIITATNKDLKAAVKEGLFREDLYYRLNVVEIKLPPLRERKEDIIPLAEHFLKESIKFFDTPLKDFSADAKKALLEYDWPGNVRELENVIKRATILSRGTLIERKDLFQSNFDACSLKELLEGKLCGILNKMVKVEKSNLYDTLLAEFEKALFTIVLKETKFNQLKAAKILGINRNTLNKKIKLYKLI
ncbi:MAG: sigma-54 dependent transcriptional regulator [Thermodesulfovibrionales bacterium]|nr:sigma-54 dependent transcriptional regulator [Thermodesulfovibrionales bacterium]